MIGIYKSFKTVCNSLKSPKKMILVIFKAFSEFKSTHLIKFNRLYLVLVI